MRSHDGYADMLSDDERFDARDLAILVHAHLAETGGMLRGSSVQLAMSGDEADLSIRAHGPDGVMRDLRLPGHQQIEETIAASGSVGMMTLPMERIFDDDRRSGSATLVEAADRMGAPLSAFGLRDFQDPPSRMEKLGQALAHMASIGAIEGQELKDDRWISIRFDDARTTVALCGANEDGLWGRTSIVDENQGPGEGVFADLGKAVRRAQGDGPGRTYDAKDGPSSQIIVKAPLLKTDATPEEKLKATAALRDAITEALSPDRPARPAVGRDGPSPRSFTRGPGEPPSDLRLMFRMQGRDLSGR